MTSPPIILRFDGGGDVGFGHATRCVALAKKMTNFYLRRVALYIRHNPTLERFITSNGLDFYSFPQNAQEEQILRVAQERHEQGGVWVLDRLFPFTNEYVKSAKRKFKVCMIQNYCEGTRYCDVVIFPIAHLPMNTEEKLAEEMEEGCLFSGFKYVMLSTSCTTAHSFPKKSYLAITSGASDPQDILGKVFKWLSTQDYPTNIYGLIGASYLHAENVPELRSNAPVNMSLGPFCPTALFQAQMAICAFGVSTYELIYHDVPFLVIARNEQSALGSKVLARRLDIPCDLGNIDNLEESIVFDRLQWLSRPENLAECQKTLKGLIDGKGIDRVSSLINGLG